jgi:hypothetical protein
MWVWPEKHGWPGLISITLESCLEDGCVGSFPEQEMWSLPQEWDPAVQAAPMMDYACPMWRLLAHTHVRRLQVLRSKCLRLVTSAPWYVGSKQMHEDLWVPFFAEHIRAGTTNFLLKLSRLWGTPSRYLRWCCVDSGRLTCKPRAKGFNRPAAATTKRIVAIIFQLGTAGIQDFPRFILRCKVNAKTAPPAFPPPPETLHLHQCVCQQSHVFSW